MGRFADASRAAGVSEQVADALLGQQCTIRTSDEGEVSCGTRVQDFLEKDGDGHPHTGFLGVDSDHTIADMLLADHGSVTPRRGSLLNTRLGERTALALIICMSAST